MKKFENAELEVVSVSETANGIFDTWFETWIIHNDSDNHCKKPVTPNDPTDPVDTEDMSN